MIFGSCNVSTLYENKDVFLLALCWAWTFSLACLLTFVGPLSAKAIGGSDFYATFTVGIFVIGTAICNIPSTTLFNVYGRRGGFTVGCLCLIIGATICLLSLHGKTMGGLLFGSLIMGMGVGFGQFYRFAAIDIAAPEHKDWAVTTVLTGGCFAAFLGPTLGVATRNLFGVQYEGCFLMMLLLGVGNLATVSMVKFPPPLVPTATLASDLGIVRSRASSRVSTKEANRLPGSDPQISLSVRSEQEATTLREALNVNNVVSNANNTATERDSVSVLHSTPKRTILSIVLSWGFIIPTLINTIAQVLMMIVMINATLELSNKGYKFIYLSLVLDLHFFSMFATGFITGILLKKYNLFYVISAGAALMGVAFVVLLTGEQLGVFFIGDMLLGISWNMLFSAGTVMLHSCYDKTEQNAIQSINEFIINAVSGIFSTVSGFILAQYGWHTVVVALLTVYLVAIGIAVVACSYYNLHYGDFMNYINDMHNSHDELTIAAKVQITHDPHSTFHDESFGGGGRASATNKHADIVTSILHQSHSPHTPHTPEKKSSSLDGLIDSDPQGRDSGNHTMV